MVAPAEPRDSPSPEQSSKCDAAMAPCNSKLWSATRMRELYQSSQDPALPCLTSLHPVGEFADIIAKRHRLFWRTGRRTGREVDVRGTRGQLDSMASFIGVSGTKAHAAGASACALRSHHAKRSSCGVTVRQTCAQTRGRAAAELLVLGMKMGLEDGGKMAARNATVGERDEVLLDGRRRDDVLNAIDWTDRENVVSKLEEMKEQGLLKKYGSAQTLARPISFQEMQLLTRRKVTPKTLDFKGEGDKSAITVSFFAVLALSISSALAIEQYLPGPDVVRYAAAFSVGGLPYVFLLFGISVPDLLQFALILARRTFSKEFRTRLAAHEAGHFLVGYLLGVPVREYKADAVMNAVQFYFDFEEAQQDSKPLRFTHEQVDELAIISLAGVVSEILLFKQASGGYADFMQLQRVANRSVPPLEPRAVQAKVRWGCVRAYTLLQQNAAALEQLTAKMAVGRPLDECIAAIEDASAMQAKETP
ncbi:hypothetical protein FVE85_3060 [Porphyridium purpureum]|uniref:Uncharacterized protein n=1 Tax=Porphyridium purpureum TaxID=35688 RepID=A0A5J4YTJ7_PORPP|nr:hypothetical protein FVE85_3060 [Porphyridium purpureum]|eukprot:POR7900..scf227_4